MANKCQTYEVTSPLTSTSGHSQMTVVVLRDQQGGQLLFQDNTNFTLESELVGHLEFQLRLSEDKKVLNLAPRFPFLLGDRITVKNELENQLCTFFIRTKKSAQNIHLTVENPASSLKSIPSLIIEVNTTTSTSPIFFRNSGDPGDRHMAIMTSDGTEIFSQSYNQVQNFDLQPSGYLSYYDNNDHWFLLLDSTYSIVDTIHGNSGYIADFHELVHLPDGTSLIMCEDLQVMDLTGYGGLANANVFGNIIQIQDANGVLLFNWRSWDHINIGETVMSLTGTNVDYAHINSIDYDLDGHLIVSARNMSQVFKINSLNGSLMWRLGGSLSNLSVLNDTNGLSVQHDARILANGHLTVFDNGVFHDPPIASAKEYIIDTSLATATLVWNYAHPYGEASGRTGNVQRLPNGNTFINWGSRQSDVLNPNFTEVTPSGDVVYQLRFSNSANYSCYRARRYPWNISTASIREQPHQELLLYPNPADNLITLKTQATDVIDFIQIVDLFGKKIMTCQNPYNINVSPISSGTYIIRAFAKELVITGKFIKR